MRASFRILQKIWDKKKGRRPCNQVTNKDPHRTPVWDLFARHAQWSTNDSIHGMSCRPRVSLPFIPSACLIPTDTSRNTTHVWIKNCSLKILYASCSHHNDRLWLAARDNRKAGSILCARITAGRLRRGCHKQVYSGRMPRKVHYLQRWIRQTAHSHRRKGKKDRILCSYPWMCARLAGVPVPPNATLPLPPNRFASLDVEVNGLPRNKCQKSSQLRCTEAYRKPILNII